MRRQWMRGLSGSSAGGRTCCGPLPRPLLLVDARTHRMPSLAGQVALFNFARVPQGCAAPLLRTRSLATATPKSSPVKAAADAKPKHGLPVALPPRENELLAKKLNNLLRNKNPITAKQYMSFLRKIADRRSPSVLSDKVVSLVPQLTFEDAKTRANDRAESQRKEKKTAKDKQTKSAVTKEKTSAQEDEEERRKFTTILASLAKMRRIESMLYVYNMLKFRERQEGELRAEAKSTSTVATIEPKWRVDTYIYNIVLDSLAKAGYMEKFAEVLQEMESCNVSKDTITYSLLYNAYSTHGEDAKAEEMLKEMKSRGMSMDLAGYNALMNRFAHKRDVDRVLETYQEMQTLGVKPDEATFSVLLDCCAQDALDIRAQWLKDHEAGEENAGGLEEERKELRRILQGKRRRMEGVMRAMKKADVRLDNILISSIARCYASIGEVNEMFDVVRFLKEEENIKLTEDNYSLMIYCAGREKSISPDRAQQILNEMKYSNVQPTAKTVNALINSFAFAGADALERFIFFNNQQPQQEPESKKASPQRDEELTLWQTLRKYGVPFSEDILFNLLKIYATREAEVQRRVSDAPKIDDDDEENVKGRARKLDRFKLAKVLRRLQSEGLEATSTPVLNSLMRFHSAYGENRVKEAHTIYNEMKKRNAKPDLQTYLILADTILSTERRLAMHDTSQNVTPQDKEATKERAELSYLLFSEMQSEGIQPNLKLFGKLIQLCGYDERRRRTTIGVDDSIKAKAEEEFKQKILAILTEMRQAGVKPDSRTLKSISSACTAAGVDNLVQPLLEELPRIFPA